MSRIKIKETKYNLTYVVWFMAKIYVVFNNFIAGEYEP